MNLEQCPVAFAEFIEQSCWFKANRKAIDIKN